MLEKPIAISVPAETPLIFSLKDRLEWRRDPGALTFLKTINPRKVAAKSWIGDATEAIDYDDVRYWRPFVALANNLPELSAILTRAEGLPRVTAVRGAVRLSSVLKPEIRRIYRTDREEPPDLEDVPRHWLMIDLDKKKEPTDFNWLSDPRRTAIWAAETYLPAAWRGVAFHYQFSNSAGIKPGLRLHYWFWLDTPKTSAELKRDFCRRYGRKQFDLAVYNPSQPHYTAAPIFIRRPDPLVGRRSGSVL